MARPKGPHKPECGCVSCGSRRRAQEAITRRAGEQGSQEPTPLVNGVTEPAEPTLDGNIPQSEVMLAIREPKQRDRIAQWIEWRAVEPDLTMLEASTRMGLSPKTLSSYVTRATKEGWLKFDDPLDRIEHEIIPQTLDNLKEFLKAKDRLVTVEVAKGTIFRQFQEAKGLIAPQTTVLALKIELPPSITSMEAAQRAIQGKIVGQGRVIEAEVVEVKES